MGWGTAPEYIMSSHSKCMHLACAITFLLQVRKSLDVWSSEKLHLYLFLPIRSSSWSLHCSCNPKKHTRSTGIPLLTVCHHTDLFTVLGRAQQFQSCCCTTILQHLCILSVLYSLLSCYLFITACSVPSSQQLLSVNGHIEVHTTNA